MTEHLLGFGLAAGQGMRLRPLTLKADGYIRSKATVRFLGERIITWLLQTLHGQGLDDVVMITRGKANRGQVKSAIGYGEQLGMRVRYSSPQMESKDTGSVGAVLDNLEHRPLFTHCTPDVTTLFVFPTDSLFEIDLSAMLQAHRSTKAAVTIASVTYPPDVIADTYGMMLCDTDGRVRGFLEKPSLHDIHQAMGHKGDDMGHLPPLQTNAGCYLMDPDLLRHLAAHPAICDRKQHALDIGGHLLPWLVKQGYPVYQHQINRMGDLGNIPAYLQTMTEVLNGQFLSMDPLLPHYPGMPDGLMIDPTSWNMCDAASGLSLQEKVARGLVVLHAPLRIGKYVKVEPGVTLSSCNIDDECVLKAGAMISNSSVGEGSIIGVNSHLHDCVTGMMVNLQSTWDSPVSLHGVALGDEVVIQHEVTLIGRITVHPRLDIPAGICLTSPVEITPASLQSIISQHATPLPSRH